MRRRRETDFLVKHVRVSGVLCISLYFSSWVGRNKLAGRGLV